MALRYNEQSGMFEEVYEELRILSFTHDGSPIRYKDESVIFRWDVQGAQRIYVNEIEISADSLSYTYPLSEAGLQDFVLKAENGDNRETETIQIMVVETPLFNIEHSKEKLRKGKGETCVIKWNILNAKSVKLITDQEEDVPFSSECIVSPEVSTDYKFEALGMDGNRTYTHIVHIGVYEESSVLFLVDKNITLPHVPIKLSWDVRNASAIELLGYGNVEQRGCKIIECDKEMVFTLKVTDSFGTTNYHQKIRMYPLLLIRSIVVPMPQIERKLNIETHFEQKNIQVNLNVNMVKVSVFNGVKTDVFVPCMRFHDLSSGHSGRIGLKTKEYKQVFRHILSTRLISVFEPFKRWWQRIKEQDNSLK